MSIELPQDLQNLEANSGIYAIWMIFHHYGVDLHIPDLVQLTQYNDEMGASSIALTVALKTLGLDVEFFTETDPDKQLLEIQFYQKAQELKVPVHEYPLSYTDIQKSVDKGLFVIVFYDTLEGMGNHSLIYEINEKEISFFDSFDAMPKEVFEQQRRVEGVCQQVIVIDDRNFVMRHS
ncbi:MAG TPA: peptidase C39 [Acinetobacter sp.]|uniref:cysteine peptidase family C39 domain-containing protein n=1 Tax=Acinetobacter variabilis TaxID=70346 RepID=UPI000EB8532B|nr:cysteine peptidase family C39 domain-containing protein [Acinetobacter variabilis]HCL60375.1 peptidase C39 [Acinetobacter sp.]